MTLSPDASLLRIPPAALFKLVTLRFSTAYLLFLEHFGHLVWKDPVILPISKSIHSATFVYMMLMPATKDLWARTTTLTALMNYVHGLCASIELLLHPSILSADRVQGWFRTLLHIFFKNNGKADPNQMADVCFVKVQKQVEYVREFARDNNAKIHVFSYCRSKIAINRHKGTIATSICKAVN